MAASLLRHQDSLIAGVTGEMVSLPPSARLEVDFPVNFTRFELVLQNSFDFIPRPGLADLIKQPVDVNVYTAQCGLSERCSRARSSQPHASRGPCGLGGLPVTQVPSPGSGSVGQVAASRGSSQQPVLALL